MSDLPALTHDQRQDLAEAAVFAERRNRPRHLVMLGLLLLVVSGLALIWGLSSYRGARTEADRERNNVFRLKQLAAMHDALTRTKADPVAGPPYAPVPNLQTRLEGLATGVGLPRPPLPQERRDRAQAGAQSLRLTYRIRHDEPGPLFNWLAKAMSEIEGLELYSLRVQPEASTWSFEVTFSRWERSGP
ncbi:MAG: hypothetical protein KIT24_09140 [Phycisphaeraceae bacterium]|nr:hypothetical protein [Phycisphaeraceae bacterium]